ncbi:hypothetical protein D9V29_07260 [Mycetocola manganoxydans]|uniref:Uncharacterized protein n=1 Tax=Mycetocola manganoxydans TaxID=699879 RepID=A0A3L6ZUI3_9MICO|nr:hypothetical protein [Mycetocola manganoxydans]RLP71646.1 hypothetical protein D9V29_07260 [Mycetocola manganoxydans]GHD38842.1 hypothetical protein GCM10008097_00900 [Mycetocola manganoxydans]
MELWNEFVAWLTAPDTRPVLFIAAVVAVAILVSALIAAAVTKAAVRRLVDQRDRDLKTAAIAALVDASSEAASWNSLTPQEQSFADRAVAQADIQLRLLPIKGAATAANWAAHQLAEMKRDSATFGFELGAARTEFRDRLLEWQARPSRTRKVFESDLERWKFETTANEKTLVAEQDAWAAREHREKYTATDAGEPSVTPAAFSGPDTTTQKLIDDVAAMDVKRAAGEQPEEKKLA